MAAALGARDALFRISTAVDAANGGEGGVASRMEAGSCTHIDDRMATLAPNITYVVHVTRLVNTLARRSVMLAARMARCYTPAQYRYAAAKAPLYAAYITGRSDCLGSDTRPQYIYGQTARTFQRSQHLCCHSEPSCTANPSCLSVDE